MDSISIWGGIPFDGGDITGIRYANTTHARKKLGLLPIMSVSPNADVANHQQENIGIFLDVCQVLQFIDVQT